MAVCGCYCPPCRRSDCACPCKDHPDGRPEPDADTVADKVRAKIAAMSDNDVVRLWDRLCAIPKDGA